MSQPPSHPLKCRNCGSVSLNVQVKAWAIWYRGQFQVVDYGEYIELLDDPVICRACEKESPFAAAEEEAKKNPEGLNG